MCKGKYGECLVTKEESGRLYSCGEAIGVKLLCINYPRCNSREVWFDDTQEKANDSGY